MNTLIQQKSLSIAIPVFNGGITLNATLESIDKQKNKDMVNTVFIINDNSSDQSMDIIKSFKKRTTYTVEIINHTTSAGLAESYNEAIRKCTSPYILTIHQDIVINDSDAFIKITRPFTDTNVAAVFPTLSHSKKLWIDYTIWQKCLFSRHIDRKEYDLTGKFDCFNVEALKKVGLFDSQHYRTAGEDADLKHKLRKATFNFIHADVDVTHAQENDPKFDRKKYIRKESQLAEARGTVLRRHGTENFSALVANFFREIILIGLLIPFINILFFIVTLLYAYVYTKNVYHAHQYNIQELLAVYLTNLLLLPTNLYYSSKGFITERQQL